MRNEETKTDGARLQRQFDLLKAKTGMRKAEFAREFKVPGGASMISQHTSGHRPIGLDAIVAYTKGFQCSVADISPTLAAQLHQTNAPLPDSEPNQPLALVNSAQAATNNIAILGQVLAGLAVQLKAMDANTRRKAMLLISDLATDPDSHATVTAMIELSIRSRIQKAE